MAPRRQMNDKCMHWPIHHCWTVDIYLCLLLYTYLAVFLGKCKIRWISLFCSPTIFRFVLIQVLLLSFIWMTCLCNMFMFCSATLRCCMIGKVKSAVHFESLLLFHNSSQTVPLRGFGNMAISSVLTYATKVWHIGFNFTLSCWMIESKSWNSKASSKKLRLRLYCFCFSSSSNTFVG